MATLTRAQPFWFGNNLNATCPLMAGGPEYPHFKETAGQTFRIGDLIYLDTNGTLAVCTLTGSVLNSKIAGIATKAASGVTGDQVYFHAIRPDDIWCMNVMHGTPASAITAQTQLGSVFGVRKDTVSGNGTLIWSVDIENAVTGATADLARVKVVGFPLKNPFDAGSLTRPAIGDVYGLVLVQFIMNACDTDGNPSLDNILQLG